MHEDKFEKQVREKMDQLHFDPKEELWSAIDREINKKKKRRLPIFWFSILGGLMLSGGLYYINTNRTILKESAIDSIKTAAKQNTPADNLNKKLVDAGQLEKTSGSQRFKTNQSLNSQRKPSSLRSQQYLIPASDKNKRATENSLPKNDSSESDPEIIGGASTLAIQENILQPANDTSVRETTTNKIPVNDSISRSVAKKVEKNKKKSSWKLGVQTDLGISNINQAAHYTTFTNNSPGTGFYYGNNTASPGFSFGGGVFVERNLSARIYFSAGINYHYYSTQLQTGNFVYAPVSNPAYGYLGSANGYYSNGSQQKYTNQYHFAELPLSFQYLLNKSIKTPIYFEPAVSFGYLITTNALYYEPSGNIYLKNSQGIQHTQVNGTAALLFGFHCQKNELRAGPLFTYGFTSILKSGYGNPEHLTYGGLKIVLVFRNK
jgi:hypothetical protein